MLSNQSPFNTIHILKNLGINQGFAYEGISGELEIQDFAGNDSKCKVAAPLKVVHLISRPKLFSLYFCW